MSVWRIILNVVPFMDSWPTDGYALVTITFDIETKIMTKYTLYVHIFARSPVRPFTINTRTHTDTVPNYTVVTISLHRTMYNPFDFDAPTIYLAML